jgi:hypothetical protein
LTSAVRVVDGPLLLAAFPNRSQLDLPLREFETLSDRSHPADRSLQSGHGELYYDYGGTRQDFLFGDATARSAAA